MVKFPDRNIFLSIEDNSLIKEIIIMEVIAINDKETVRVAKFGDMFHLQKTVSKFFARDLWHDINITKHEWMASKWILDYGLRVSTDYPTIDEIREKQKAKKK